MLCEYFRIIVRFGKTRLKTSFVYKLQHFRAFHVFSGLATLVHQCPRTRRVGTGCVRAVPGATALFEAHVEVTGNSVSPKSELHMGVRVR